MRVLVVFCILGFISISIQAPTATPEDSECPKNHTSPKTFPHPTNCHKYLQCANGTKLELECPTGQQYNKDLGVCDSPRFANCKLSSNETATSNTTTIPPNMVEVKDTTEASFNTTKLQEDTKDANKSKDHMNATTENSTGTPTTIKVDTSSHGSVDSVKQNQTSTTPVPTDLNKRTNETSKMEFTTPSNNESSAATTPAGTTVSTGQIKVKDETEPTEDESAENEEDKKIEGKAPESNSVEKEDNKGLEKHDDASTSAETKHDASADGQKKELGVTTMKPDNKASTTKNGDKPETSTAAGGAEPKKADVKELSRTGDNTSKEVTQPELGGEEERKKVDGKKPLVH